MSGGTLDQVIIGLQAETHRFKSEYVEAREIQTLILRNVSMEHEPVYHALTLLNIIQIDVEIGSVSGEMQRDITTANLLCGKAGYTPGVIWCKILQAALELNKQNLSASYSIFQQCLRATWGNNSEAISYCLERLGNVSLWSTISKVSSTWTNIFLIYSLKSKQRLEIYKALQFLGDILLEEGDQPTAASLFTVALQGFTQMDVHCSRAECMLRLGD
jgi:hypothetical protein